MIRRRVEFGMTLEDAFRLPDFHKGEMERLAEAGKANEPHTITQTLPGWCRDYSRPQAEVTV